jgi:uncharacterized protein YcfJ
MSRSIPVLGLTALLALAACTAPMPTGPSVMALPPQGKTFEAFQEDEYVCRAYAIQATGGANPTQAGQQAAVGSAVLGTALGAGVGAALGSLSGQAGAGAAVGGAAGLLMGSAVGANNAYAASAGAQNRYDSAYTQCMYSKGNAVHVQPPAYAAAPYGYAPGYATYPPAYYGPMGSATVIVGGGWGGGYYRPRPYRRYW